MINEIVSAAETSSGAIIFVLILIIVLISAAWAAVQMYRAWKTFRQFVRGRSN